MPVDWYDDDHLVATMLDVLRTQADTVKDAQKDAKKKGGTRGR